MRSFLMRSGRDVEPGAGVEEVLRAQLADARNTITKLERILAEAVQPNTAAYWRKKWEQDRRNLTAQEDRIAALEGRRVHGAGGR